jgi:hypothetical protein
MERLKILIILLIIAIIAGFVFFQINKKSQPPAPERPGPINDIKEIGPLETVTDFPGASILPLPQTANITKTYKITSPQGEVQITKILESSWSLKENFDYFKNVLSDKKKGWKITGEIGIKANDNHAALFAERSEGILSINLTFNPATKKTIIDLSFLLNKI